jgi:hypothetical protein
MADTFDGMVALARALSDADVGVWLGSSRWVTVDRATRSTVAVYLTAPRVVDTSGEFRAAMAALVSRDKGSGAGTADVRRRPVRANEWEVAFPLRQGLAGMTIDLDTPLKSTLVRGGRPGMLTLAK